MTIKTWFFSIVFLPCANKTRSFIKFGATNYSKIRSQLIETHVIFQFMCY